MKAEPTVRTLLHSIHFATADESLYLDRLETDIEYIEAIVEYIEYMLSRIKERIGDCD